MDVDMSVSVWPLLDMLETYGMKKFMDDDPDTVTAIVNIQFNFSSDTV